MAYWDVWFPFTDPGEMEQTDYDVLIVGTGAGGGAVLWRLCERWGLNAKRIGVVEAGPPFLPTHQINLPTYNVDQVGRYWVNPRFLETVGTAHSNNEFPPLPVEYTMVKALGGKMMHWGGATPRMDPVDLAGWPVSMKEMNEYYTAAERVMNVTGFLTDGSSIQEQMLKRLQAGGFPDAVVMPRAADLQPTRYGRIHSGVFFSAMDFLSKALNRKPFDLAVRSRAIRVLMEGGRISGVQMMTPDKKSYVLKAKTVVVSAGTIESPRLLLYSGIPGEAIGHYLGNHSRLDARGVVERTDFPEVLGIMDIRVPRTITRPYQIEIAWSPHYQYKEKPVQQEWGVAILPSGVVESRYDNRITLDPAEKDEYGVPKALVYFSYNERDYAVIRQMGEGLKTAAAAMKATLTGRDGLPPITLRRPGGENHDSGSCRMGSDPRTSATNRYGQIHGVPGLYVADNSVLHTTGAANPTLTTVALAIRTADYIVEQSK
ncbi:GMC family oxidoreductase [Paenibacillus sp. N4]|uniref:GMC oxidoreductase n=1 Tax=Paenibacillus vietnamensis TaxID=2590547 RepID=UPI001CD0757B|nr:GMC family oxidoreductase [Paenibacillus vietnamensis]MCA0756466.1 GMC family oxidoreductase [Paenibacillus vietnamensis]